jgi:hypothetical protein
VDVRGTDLTASRQMGQAQWHMDVGGHENQHALVKPAHRQPQKTTQVGLAPASGQIFSHHVQIVKQTDLNSCLLLLIGCVKVLFKHPACLKPQM